MMAIATPLDATTIDNVVAYIATLPDNRAHATVKGDAARGASRYTTCAYCHGAAGQGSWSTNAPRLAGMSDWYLARQLQQFRQGHRGRHPQDFHGAQMATMSRDRGRRRGHRRPAGLHQHAALSEGDAMQCPERT